MVHLTTAHLPRDIQSKLHDMADTVGEKIARGELVEPEGLPRAAADVLQRCVCVRFSKIEKDGRVAFVNWQDPDCQYIHLTPLPEPFVVTPAP